MSEPRYWTTEEKEQLLSIVKKYSDCSESAQTLEDIAWQLTSSTKRRTGRAVFFQLKKFALEYSKQKKSLTEISELIRLPKDKIKSYVEDQEFEESIFKPVNPQLPNSTSNQNINLIELKAFIKKSHEESVDVIMKMIESSNSIIMDRLQYLSDAIDRNTMDRINLSYPEKPRKKAKTQTMQSFESQDIQLAQNQNDSQNYVREDDDNWTKH